MFYCHKCNQNAPMKEARGQNKLFQSASLLMCYCSFAIGHFLILKNQSERQAIELLFKFQISPDRTSSNTNKSCVFTNISPFMNFTVLSMEFPIRNCLPFFFRTNGNFCQIILSHTQGRSPNKSLIKIQMSFEIKLLVGTRVYYCFNSKGDNFKVNQL